MTRIEQLISTYPELEICAEDIQAAFQTMRDCFSRGDKVLTCGNGGSAADAEHIVGELMKGYLLKRRIPEEIHAKLVSSSPQNGGYLASHLQGALPAISLVSQTSLLSAIANDTAADMVYAQQVYAYGREGDTLIGISTSGNARNVIHAMQVARAGYRGLMAGQRVVVPGVANKLVVGMLRYVPRGIVLALTDRQLRGRHR